MTPSAPFLWHSLDIQQWQVLIGEVEKLGSLSAMAFQMSVYLAHLGGPFLDISPIFIRQPEDLWFRVGGHEAGEGLGILGVAAGVKVYDHIWGT